LPLAEYHLRQGWRESIIFSAFPGEAGPVHSREGFISQALVWEEDMGVDSLVSSSNMENKIDVQNPVQFIPESSIHLGQTS
jgi:hypothetical protein